MTFTTILHSTYLVIVLISAIFSLKAFRLNWPLPYKLFSAFLFTALFTEGASTLLKYYPKILGAWNPFGTDNNYWIITFLLIPQYLIQMAVFYEVLKSRRIKKIIAATAVFFTVFAINNFMFWQGIDAVNNYTHILGSLVMLLLVFAYFEQVRDDYAMPSLKKQSMAWISLGNFIYHLLNIPYLFSINYLVKFNLSAAIVFHNLYLFILILTYLSFIKAFLCPTPQQK
jgi:hypothetical protein